MISTPTRRCERSFILNTFQALNVSAHTVFLLPTYDRMERIDYRAETSSKRTNQPLDLYIAGQRANLARILLPPNPSPSLSLSIVILATSQARYFIIISSLSRLPGFRRTTLFPATTEIPVAVPVVSRRFHSARIVSAKITFRQRGIHTQLQADIDVRAPP